MESVAVWLKAAVPGGRAVATEDFEIVKSAFTDELEGENVVVFKLLALSADPFQRGRMKNGDRRVLDGFVSGVVVKSSTDSVKEGNFYGGYLPYQTLQKLSAKQLGGMWNLTDFVTKETISLGCGVLGMPGATAYGGLLKVLRPKKGDTLFVSAASGAVGALVGQIAKLEGCIVIGSAGGAKKNDYIRNTLGYDFAIDYKTISSSEELQEAIKKVAPEGIDMNFESVGGMHFDACFKVLKSGGRIAICGTISQYDSEKYIPDNINIAQMIYTQQRIEGFTAGQYLRAGEFLPFFAQLIKEDKIHAEETVFTGVEKWPEAFVSVMSGGHLGKVVVRTE